MSYALVSDILIRVDNRRLGQLVMDDGTVATAAAMLTGPPVDPISSATTAYINLQAALDDAAGMIDAECLRGGRYLPTDLPGLVTAGTPTASPPYAPTPSQIQALAFLVRLNCDLAYGLLVERRGYTQQEAMAQAPGFARALSLLDKLGTGELVFNVPAAITAGQPQNVALDQNLQLVSGVTRLFGDLVVNPNNPGGYPLTSDNPY